MVTLGFMNTFFFISKASNEYQESSVVYALRALLTILEPHGGHTIFPKNHPKTLHYPKYSNFISILEEKVPLRGATSDRYMNGRKGV